MKEKAKENIWNVPNVLTLLRLALIPVFWVLMMQDRLYIALCVFVAASLTDILDGYIARKYSLITNFGKLMDPLADKLMVLSVLLSLVIKGIVPWPVLAVLLFKESAMVFGGLTLLRHKVVVYSVWIGKIAQASVVVALVSCFFHEWIEKNLGFPLHLALLWAAVALTLAALAKYAAYAVKTYREIRARERAEKEQAEEEQPGQ